MRKVLLFSLVLMSVLWSQDNWPEHRMKIMYWAWDSLHVRRFRPDSIWTKFLSCTTGTFRKVQADSVIGRGVRLYLGDGTDTTINNLLFENKVVIPCTTASDTSKKIILQSFALPDVYGYSTRLVFESDYVQGVPGGNDNSGNSWIGTQRGAGDSSGRLMIVGGTYGDDVGYKRGTVCIQSPVIQFDANGWSNSGLDNPGYMTWWVGPKGGVPTYVTMGLTVSGLDVSGGSTEASITANGDLNGDGVNLTEDLYIETADDTLLVCGDSLRWVKDGVVVRRIKGNRDSLPGTLLADTVYAVVGRFVSAQCTTLRWRDSVFASDRTVIMKSGNIRVRDAIDTTEITSRHVRTDTLYGWSPVVILGADIADSLYIPRVRYRASSVSIGSMVVDTSGVDSTFLMTTEGWLCLAPEGGGGSPPGSEIHDSCNTVRGQVRDTVGQVDIEWTKVVNEPTTYPPDPHAHSIRDTAVKVWNDSIQRLEDSCAVKLGLAATARKALNSDSLGGFGPLRFRDSTVAKRESVRLNDSIATKASVLRHTQDSTRLNDSCAAKQSTSEKGQTGGYAGLGSPAYVPTGQLGSGTPSASTYLRGDQTWSTPAVGLPLSHTNPLEITDVGTNTHAQIDIQITALTTDLMADSLHRHSELSASDGTPNPALQVDTAGKVGIGTTAPEDKLVVLDALANGKGITTGNIQLGRFSDGTASEGRVGYINGTPHIAFKSGADIDLNGSISVNQATYTANHTVSATDYVCLADATGGWFISTLPAANSCNGRIYYFKCIAGYEGPGSHTIAPAGFDMIENGGSYSLGYLDAVMLISDGGGNWWVIGH